MADQYSNEGGSTSSSSGGGSSSTVELKIKTLDSQIYSFQVEKNMPVSAFKEKIANEIGLPVGQQRLIFRGRVLKDEHLLSEYQVENGHTLHLVARQPAEPQTSSDRSSDDASGNTGTDTSTGATRNRIGQISHSVVLGTFNVGDQGEGMVPDIGQVIGAVLNSFGIGGGQNVLNGIGGIQSSAMPHIGVQVPSTNETSRANVGGQNQAGNQTSGQPVSSQPFQSRPQAMQIPATGQLPFPSINSPLPDSLSTLSEFIARVEQVLAQGCQSNTPSSSSGNLNSSRVELPSNERGLRTPEALSIVLRNAEHLLSGRTVAALSHIAGRLEQEGASTDANIRGQIQTEAMQVGLGMHYLGALFLELGRAIWTLRMGQTPAESAVNPGPAVFISPSGPNPIMVQPFPTQTGSVFGGSVPPSSAMTSGPTGIGSASRNINIHIHAGTSLAPVVSALNSRASNGEGGQGERSNGTGSGGTGPVRVVPVGSVIAASVPALAAGVAVPTSASVQLGRSMPSSQPQSDPQSIPLMLAEMSAQLRRNMPAGQGENQVIPDNEQSNSSSANQAGGQGISLHGHVPEGNFVGTQDERGRVSTQSTEVVLGTQDTSSTLVHQNSSREISQEAKPLSVNASSSGEKHEHPDAPKTVPRGLGLGGLERKKRAKQPKDGVLSSDTRVTSTPDQSIATGIGQQLLQSLASRSSAANKGGSNEASSVQNSTSGETNTENTPLREQGSRGQIDLSSAMSQGLNNPAIGGLLGGISDQTGGGPPNVLGNMLQQLCQNPQIMSSVSQIAQQVDSEDIENMLSGASSGQPGGGLDLSRMIQQMMPVVSQVLGSSSTRQESSSAVGPGFQLQNNATRTFGVEDFNDQDIQLDLQEVARRIEQSDTPADIFHVVTEQASLLGGIRNGGSDVVDELGSDVNLISEYIEMLQRDLNRHIHDGSS